jgi:beta-lactamase regulating signal transducer with metallopeptidase domain
MAFITLSTLVTDPFVAALCNTLVHSLWQGLVLAALTGVIIIFTRKASAASRYNLLIAALALFAIGVSLTFITQFKQANVATINTAQALPFDNTIHLNNTVELPNSSINTPVADVAFSDKLFNYLNHNHNTIVLIWFLIICAKSIQLAFGLWGVQRLKTKQVSAVSDFWNDRIQQLANSIAIKQSIGLLESGLAKVPMVIGNLKPVILIPIGLLTALTTAEVEAILVHELAHIKRRDYLVNLLQSLMEIVFFFNPAVLWISQLIKAERENCCDDLALAQSSNKVNYIRALVSCEEYQQSVPAYAMAFPGGKNSLFDRVKRITGNRNHSLNLFEKTVLAICLVVSGLCMSAYAEKENIKRAAHAVVKAIQHIKDEAAPAQPAIIAEDPAIKQAASPILSAEMPSLHDAVNIQRNDTDTVTRIKLTKQNVLKSLGRLNGSLVNSDSTTRDREDMQKYLADTREMTRSGDYEEALKRYIWFHDNAIMHDKSISAVRTSFALSGWKTLADKYPPALTALIKVRDDKTNLLKANGGPLGLFVDVTAINRTLTEDAKTIALFKAIDKDHPDMAKHGWFFVRTLLFDAKEYDLIKKYIRTPYYEFTAARESYKNGVSMSQRMVAGQETYRQLIEERFIKQVTQLIDYSLAIHDTRMAGDIKKEADLVINDAKTNVNTDVKADVKTNANMNVRVDTKANARTNVNYATLKGIKPSYQRGLLWDAKKSLFVIDPTVEDNPFIDSVDRFGRHHIKIDYTKPPYNNNNNLRIKDYQAGIDRLYRDSNFLKKLKEFEKSGTLTPLKSEKIKLDRPAIDLNKSNAVTTGALAPLKAEKIKLNKPTLDLNVKLNIPNMADALYNAGLIKDKKKFTARITNDELIVNGVKQSEENHQKILKLYQKKSDDKVNLSFTYPGK